MKNKRLMLLTVSAIAVIAVGCSSKSMDKMKMSADMPFSDPKSVAFSKALWKAMDAADLVGSNAKADKPYKGSHPHGAVLETLSKEVSVKGVKSKVIVKRNYGGPGVSIANVSADRAKYLKAVTVMFKRESGYDSDNQNWFWAKYKPDGSLHKNPKGMKLAGRVAKGKPKGCISCHKAAPGGDYQFIN